MLCKRRNRRPKKSIPLGEYVKVPEAAKLIGSTLGCVYSAIQDNRLTSFKLNGSYHILTDNIIYFIKNRWNRAIHSKYQGEPLFDEKHLSVKMAAQKSKLSVHQIYYLMRRNIIELPKRNGSYFITPDQLETIKKLCR